MTKTDNISINDNSDSSNQLRKLYDDLYQRRLITDCANKDNFYNLLPQEKVIYFGIDCTGLYLHLGHFFQLIQTIRFVKEGFRVILLLGEATSRIGDPSDKTEERPQLDVKTLKCYRESIEDQLKRILFNRSTNIKLDFAPLDLFYEAELLTNIYCILQIDINSSTSQKWKKFLSFIWPLTNYSCNYSIVNNDSWLNNLNCVDFIDQVGRYVSVNYLLTTSWIKKRIDTGLSYLAFSYSLLQAYDFYYLYRNFNCCGQLGGQDQWVNMCLGIKVIRNHFIKNKAFAFGFSLLSDEKGNKISKSSQKEKKISTNSTHQDFYDFFRNMPDEQAYNYAMQFTFLTIEQIEELKKLNNPPKLRIFQRILLELMWFFNYGDLSSLRFFIKSRNM